MPGARAPPYSPFLSTVLDEPRMVVAVVLAASRARSRPAAVVQRSRAMADAVLDSRTHLTPLSSATPTVSEAAQAVNTTHGEEKIKALMETAVLA